MNRKRLLTLIAVLAAAACSSSTGPDERSDTVLAQAVELTLTVGEEHLVDGTVLRVLFSRVTADSRCPVDVECVWEGNAAVELGLTLGTGPTVPNVVNTALEPRSAQAGGFTVTLLEVDPEPTSTEAIDPQSYRIKVRVEG